MPFEIIRNDITTMHVDAIVNPTNSGMYGTEGVDGAVRRAAGHQLREACRRIAPCSIGEVKVTSAYALPCRFIIHTVGPTWKGGGEGEQVQLATCYRSTLSVAKAYHLESVAFPLIPAGTYGYPRDLALRAAIDEIGAFLLENDMMVYIVVFDRESFRISSRLRANIEQFITDVQSAREDQRQLWYHDPMATDWQAERGEFDFLTASRSQSPIIAPAVVVSRPDEKTLNQFLRKMDKSFSKILLEMIDQRGMSDSECYHRANISRQLFLKSAPTRPISPASLRCWRWRSPYVLRSTIRSIYLKKPVMRLAAATGWMSLWNFLSDIRSIMYMISMLHCLTMTSRCWEIYHAPEKMSPERLHPNGLYELCWYHGGRSPYTQHRKADWNERTGCYDLYGKG